MAEECLRRRVPGTSHALAQEHRGRGPSALNDLRDVIEFDGQMEDLDHLWE